MTPAQRRIIGVLTGAVVLVFAAVAIVVLTNQSSDTEPTSTVAAAPTTTTSTNTTTSTTSTSAPTTTTTTEPTTTSSSTTTEPTTTTTGTTLPPSEILILGPENVDGIMFGTDAEEAIASFAEILGPPTTDTGWVPPTNNEGDQVYGPCPGTSIRVLDWSNLTTVYTNAKTQWANEGTRHFFFYSYVLYDVDLLGLETAEGIGLGSTTEDLRAAYGDAVDIQSDEFGDYFHVSVPEPGVLWGFLSGPDGTVVSIQGGTGCGE
ncbi:hypothetical protein BMS3Abin02_00830 [bacterium BMS3Abin02]|nr:hypothetical protein BMS3Abin02_00830 [bacterium BMS3Abin02]